VPVNAADDAVLDEAAEREAFQRAVMEWRRGASATGAGSSSLSVSRRDSSDTQTYSLLSLPLSHAEEAEEGGAHRRDPEGGGSASSKATTSRDHSLWKNPFLEEAGTEGAGVGEGDALLDLLADDPDVKGGGGQAEGAGSTRRGASRGASRGGGSLLGDPDTYLDEAKEHEVCTWLRLCSVDVSVFLHPLHVAGVCEGGGGVAVWFGGPREAVPRESAEVGRSNGRAARDPGEQAASRTGGGRAVTD